ncbi:unnamed protein product [Didymodactylos carnosus]|uniref:Uncharacterized protein n=1 Tax=Didymodactylos carnosus TaxID=1234261 RepID=A0A816CEY1_9BILA|nr:unnamed protein product [Didymodactylos carnosus]CAF4510242.1 unnamed protein product [Didymodactylos carnosus]
MRGLLAALLMLWIIFYDMEYSILQQTSTKKLKIRKLIHALLLGVISVETLRYAAAVQLWPGTFKDLLEKLNEDALYFSITIPA